MSPFRFSWMESPGYITTPRYKVGWNPVILVDPTFGQRRTSLYLYISQIYINIYRRITDGIRHQNLEMVKTLFAVYQNLTWCLRDEVSINSTTSQQRWQIFSKIFVIPAPNLHHQPGTQG